MSGSSLRDNPESLPQSTRINPVIKGQTTEQHRCGAPATRRSKLPLDLTRGHISTKETTALCYGTTATGSQRSGGLSFLRPHFLKPRAVDHERHSRIVIGLRAELGRGLDS